MALELHYATACAVEHADPQGLVPSTAQAVLYAADGSVVQTCVVALPTWTTTVAAGTTRSSLVLASVSGIVAGRKYAVTSKGVVSVFTAATIDTAAKAVTLVGALQESPDVDSVVSDLTMTTSLAAPGESRVGSGYRLDWQYTNGTTAGFHSQSVVIVHWKWTPPASAGAVRDFCATAYRSLRKPDEYFAQVAQRANDRIDRAVLATGRRPYLFGDHDVWSAAGMAAVRYELALDGQTPQGSNAGIYQDQLRRELEGEIKTIISSLQDYDRDGDGAISEPEQRGLWWSVETTR
jgi:hypothetical protein